MLKSVIKELEDNGYKKVTDFQGNIYIKKTENEVYTVVVSGFSKEIYEGYPKFISNLSLLMTGRYGKMPKILSLMAVDDSSDDRLKELSQKISNLWYVDLVTGRLILYEDQSADFDGLYGGVEKALQSVAARKKDEKFRITPANMTIVLLNVLIFGIFFLYDFFAGKPIFDYGNLTLSRNGVESGKVYQLLTAMFLHHGISHLFNNMLLLTYVGCELEKRIGTLKYTIVYLFTGLVGNCLTFLLYTGDKSDINSLGASGAVFGVLGALFMMIIFRRRESDGERGLNPRRMGLMMCLTIYYGLTTVGVNNVAHIGGVLSGILMGFLLSKTLDYDKI